VLTLVVCLGVLFWFKYANFLMQSVLTVVNKLAAKDYSLTIDVILPIGISFYTFQTLSYVIDVYRGDFPAETHPGYYALFVVYFPQLVAGPIENPRNLLPQLKTEQHLNREDFEAGLRFLISGFFRKCVVADCCGIFVNNVFDQIDTAGAPAILGAGALFCFQMYNDFAGYSEIASGSARLMGIRLMQNFNRPYLSQTYAEFFRRWHISLNQWFTQYLYIPLGGSRKGTARKIFNTIVVFSLCGLWHGANWTYLLWGLYAAFWVCFETVVKKPSEAFAEKYQIDLKNSGVILFRRLVMFLIFIPAALLFRAVSVSQTGLIFSRLFTAWNSEALTGFFTQMGLTAPSFLFLILILLIMNELPEWQSRTFKLGFRFEELSDVIQSVFLILAIALCWLYLLSTEDAAAFAYFQF